MPPEIQEQKFVEPPTFVDIMTKKIVFYDDEFVKTCKDFCKERDIICLPSVKDLKKCVKYEPDKDTFTECEIVDEQKVKNSDILFDSNIINRFRSNQILFVYYGEEMIGVVHYCDYNRNPVFIYLYSLIMELEKSLRKLLDLKGYKNNDMINYLKKVKKRKHKFAKDLPHLEPFQTFFLNDLITFINDKKIMTLPKEINSLRNMVAHAKNVVRYKDFETKRLVYDYNSFEKFFKSVQILKESYRRITNKIHYLEMENKKCLN